VIFFFKNSSIVHFEPPSRIIGLPKNYSSYSSFFIANKICLGFMRNLWFYEAAFPAYSRSLLGINKN
jgi:hypothetical protein